VAFVVLNIMEEFKFFNSIIEDTVRNTSYVTVIISSIVFISYTIIIKLIDYFRHKDDKKSIVEMGLAVKEVSNNVAKLNAILDNLFQDITKKNLEKGKIVIELAFFNFQYKIVNLCRNIIINNNIDINKEYVVASITKTVNTEFYRVYHTLSLYEIKNIPLSNFLKENWKDDCIKDVLAIVYNGQEDKLRISQINNNLGIKIDNWIVYINNKYSKYE
jgi:hypothetical protein